MGSNPKRSWTKSGWLAAAALFPWMLACEPAGPARSPDRAASTAPEATYQADVAEGLGVAVAILVDTSGSMRDTAPGDTRSKAVVAREAIEAMLDATDTFVLRRPDFPVHVGIYSFSSSVRVLRSTQKYDRAAIRSALGNLPRPGGGTAIGEALLEARPSLYRVGVFRKNLLVVTDGENTSGRSPDLIAREIWRKSEGAVRVHFVAFDTSPQAFAFLKDVGGDVIGAGNSGELRQALDGIYQGKILAEAAGVAEREPGKP